jgi:hypothetical protein
LFETLAGCTDRFLSGAATLLATTGVTCLATSLDALWHDSWHVLWGGCAPNWGHLAEVVGAYTEVSRRHSLVDVLRYCDGGATTGPSLQAGTLSYLFSLFFIRNADRHPHPSRGNV